MNFIHHTTPLNASSQRAITIGNFDGVHIGHETVLDKLVSHAKAHHLIPTVITFDPNPKSYFANIHGKSAPTRILPLRDKVALFKQHGIVDIVVMPFNQALAQMPAAQFIEDILINSLNAKYLLVGDDFKFGAGRTGNFELLEAMSQKYGYTLQSLHSIVQNNERISSSIIRTLLANGDLTQATALLGHAYTLSGHVIYGQQLGRTIGVPTINLKMPDNLATQGIFTVTVELNGLKYQGVASIGTRPSVKTNGQCWCEVHLFDFNQNVYGQIVCVTLLHKIRDEEKFNGMDTLMAAIHNDIQIAKSHFLTIQ